MNLYLQVILVGWIGLASGMSLLGPRQCRKAAYDCTAICNSRSGNCQVSRKDLSFFFSACRSLFQWEVCLEQVLSGCSLAGRKYVRPMVTETIMNLKNHCDSYLCESGVERCFGTLRIVRNARTKQLTPKSLDSLCNKKAFLTSCYKDLNQTQDVFSCPGATSVKTPQYLEYWGTLQSQCDEVIEPDVEEESPPAVDGKDEATCLDKAQECTEMCQGGTCRMESTVVTETIDKCRSLFDWEFCVDNVAAEECPVDSAAIAGIRDIIKSFKFFCKQELCDGGIEQCFQDIRNLTVNPPGRDGLNRDNKITLCNSGTTVSECGSALDGVQAMYGCRGVVTYQTPTFQSYQDFITEKCDDMESFIDIPEKSDFECLEEAEDCTHLCTDRECNLPYENLNQFIGDCTSLFRSDECVDGVAEECPARTPSITQVRDILKTMRDHCENTLCSGGVELCFQGQTVVVNSATGKITYESLSALCPVAGPIEECASALQDAQIAFNCRRASSNKTADFKRFLQAMKDDCPDLTEIGGETPIPTSPDEEGCLAEIDKCSPFCTDGVCRMQWGTTFEMIDKCSLVAAWRTCVQGSELLCPVNCAIIPSTLDIIDKIEDVCRENTCDGGVEQCFDGFLLMLNANGELGEEQTAEVCNRAGDIQNCAERLGQLQESYQCPGASSASTERYNDYFQSLPSVCNMDDQVEEITGPGDDECRVMAGECSYLCNQLRCRMASGSRMELFRNCEHLFEFDNCLRNVEAMCNPEPIEDYRRALEKFQKNCDTEVCSGGVESCFAGMTVIVEQDTGELAESGMDQLCRRASGVAECSVTMSVIQALYQCPGALSSATAQYSEYYDQMVEECGVVVEEGAPRDKVRLVCDESKAEVLYCLTCDTTNEDRCASEGTMEPCDVEQPVCEHTVARNARGRVRAVRRRCTHLNLCNQQTYGYDSEQCASNGNKKICTSCTYSGAQCVVEDVDECSEGTDECDDYASCQNTMGSYTCSCRRGFSGNGKVCTDDNECTDGSADCSENAVCSNDPGSYSCTCREGFAGDGRNCRDINECTEGGADCDRDATCTNTEGSYTCQCKEGFSGDGATCQDDDECADGSNSCSENAVCTNTVGSFACTCREGFSGNGNQCSDNDECTEGTHDCAPMAECYNTPGSHTCVCSSGYRGDGKTCDDVDECMENLATCGDYAVCINNPGSYTCECQDGYYGDGQTCWKRCSVGYSVVNNERCVDVDECAEGLNNCADNAQCTNVPGSFTCRCNPNYEGDGTYCLDIDECDRETDNCDENARCDNTYGGYTCACRRGFTGDGVTCDDIDECAENRCGNNSICTNTVGDFICDCVEGYLLYGRRCVDIDECLVGTAGCDEKAICTNLPGSFECACPPNMYGNGYVCEALQ